MNANQGIHVMYHQAVAVTALSKPKHFKHLKDRKSYTDYMLPFEADTITY